MSELKSFLHQADPEVHDPTHPISDAKIRSDVAAIVAAQPHTVMKRSQWLGVVAASAAVVVGAGTVTMYAFDPIGVRLEPASQSTAEASETPSVTETSQPTPTPDTSASSEVKSDYQFKAPRKVAPQVSDRDFSSSTQTVKTSAGSIMVKDLQPAAQQAARLVKRNVNKPSEYSVIYSHFDNQQTIFSGKVLRDGSPELSSVRLADDNVTEIGRVEFSRSTNTDLTLLSTSNWKKLVKDPTFEPSLCAEINDCQYLDEDMAYGVSHDLVDAERRGYILASLAKNLNWVVSSSNVSGAPGIKYTKKASALSSSDPLSFVVDPASGRVVYYQGGGEEHLLRQDNTSRSDMQKDVKDAGSIGVWGGPDSEDCPDLTSSSRAYVQCVRSVW